MVDRTKAHEPVADVSQLLKYLASYKHSYTHNPLAHMPIKMCYDITEELIDIEVGIVVENDVPTLIVKRKGELS